MGNDEKMKKIEELKFELVKSKGNAQKGSSRAKEIKKTIARILTLNNSSEQVRASSAEEYRAKENKNSKVENKQ